ncbi:hypothetical protein [Magnetofaba australis]|uniref:Uncharacterized protein n=1 Tax=Magnetofaba australis IT-1 TaxID=1434232 RepID=A0A1Y2K3W7_9PROT|nr:hypothetical protein [Magnetofaba australis]OSM02347.1 hypothetical protein MAIT1_02477 [Magnetofaba australis IT-1]
MTTATQQQRERERALAFARLETMIGQDVRARSAEAPEPDEMFAQDVMRSIRTLQAMGAEKRPSILSYFIERVFGPCLAMSAAATAALALYVSVREQSVEQQLVITLAQQMTGPGLGLY